MGYRRDRDPRFYHGMAQDARLCTRTPPRARRRLEQGAILNPSRLVAVGTPPPWRSYAAVLVPRAVARWPSDRTSSWSPGYARRQAADASAGPTRDAG